MKHLLPLLSLLLLFMTAYAQNDLPPNGAEIPLSMIALNTPLTIRSSRITVDFRGGLKQHVDVDPNDPDNSRRLRVVGFRMIAELPEGGTVTIEQNDVDEEAKSRLRNPVDLVVIDDPDKVVIATIQQFPVKIGGRS
ncbi:hypothetical protein BGZ97_005390 [Linnemannia gamsii]|uniref:Uncharacterized protein n=1 Tax=Linnemannia gamsii TaxID=64522 RepID=A0A9P6QT10_9FUNG|nr:hypothetical protein BGZ97_005390 [Linnemannia gamsii]